MLSIDAVALVVVVVATPLLPAVIGLPSVIVGVVLKDDGANKEIATDDPVPPKLPIIPVMFTA
jgi:hypothetical protein